MQVVDGEACGAIVRTFAEEARQPNFPGLLVDFDHSSHDPAQPTTAAGWLMAVEEREEGLFGRVRWSDLGAAALRGGRYRLASPVWNRGECEEWRAPAGPEGKETVHLRPRRLDRLALTNDPNLPGLTPLTNRRETVEASPGGASSLTINTMTKNLREDLVRHLQLDAALSDDALVNQWRREREELETLRNRCRVLLEAQAESDLERFAEVITNREAVRGQLLANREGTLALLNALRRPEPVAPWHEPRARRPDLALLSPVAAEEDPAAARRIANRARELQSRLKIGHHAAFRLAEAEV
jgi:phage I-like protein